ncbi:MAG TPA: P-loop NTPase fold protein [Terriglobales bacterium]|nr:P-loop NTPase fold protein [Terriglobales bacterium]
MWTDNETDIDFLNFSGVAKTAAAMIRQVQPKPVSIGVSGAWGVGKSSLIKLIRNELMLDKSAPKGLLSDQNTFVFVEFNAWLYQGYDDARAALLEIIAQTLQDEAIARHTAGDKALEFAKRVNWFRALKLVGHAATALAAAHFGHPGVGLPGLFGTAFGGTQHKGDAKEQKAEKPDKVGEKEDPWLKAVAKDTPPKEIHALRSALEDALCEMNITLVVLIDDLDRCLPETAISTLEAIRLLLFMDHTAFVIAADEAMIKHAVKRHFQGVDDTLVTNYFDKLIQVPIRVPQLGVQEVRAYMMLLFIEASRLLDGKDKEDLRREICARLGRTWKGERVDADFVKRLRPQWPDGLESQLDTADRLAALMTGAKDIAGNPRLIKRFLNAISLRLSLAKAQGVAVDEAILTKLLLFERCGSTDAYEALVRSVTDDVQGHPTVLGPMETDVRKSDKVEFGKPWDDRFLRDWLSLDPTLADKDLRGALYVSREHAPLVLPENRLSQAASDVLNALIEHPDMADSLKDKFVDIDARSLGVILDKLLELARGEQEWGAPKILTACLAVSRTDIALGRKVAAFLKDRPASQIKASIIPKIRGEAWSPEVFAKWQADDEVIGVVKAAITRKAEGK